MNNAASVPTLQPSLSGVLTIFIPLYLWKYVMLKWDPQSKLGSSLKFSLWPTIVFSFLLGNPISEMIFGIDDGTFLLQTILVLLGVFIISAPLFFAFAWWRK